MSTILALVFVVAFIYLLGFSCTFNNHDYETIKSEGYSSTLRCTKCGHTREYSDYDGICG